MRYNYLSNKVEREMFFCCQIYNPFSKYIFFGEPRQKWEWKDQLDEGIFKLC